MIVNPVFSKSGKELNYIFKKSNRTKRRKVLHKKSKISGRASKNSPNNFSVDKWQLSLE